jgi:hypothetical protein
MIFAVAVRVASGTGPRYKAALQFFLLEATMSTIARFPGFIRDI